MEVDEDFVERKYRGDHDALGIDGVGRFNHAALVHHDLHDVADVLVGDHDEALYNGFADLLDDAHIGEVGGIVDHENLAVGLHHLVHHARVGRDDIHVILAAESFDDNLHVEESEEAAAESESKGHGTFRHVVERGIVDLKLAHRCFQLFKVGGIDGIDAAEDHGLYFLEAGKRLGGRFLGVGEGVTNLDLCGALDVADEITDIAGPHGLGGSHLGGEDADLLDLVGLVRGHQADLGSGLDLTGKDTHIAHDSAVGVKEGVKDEGPQDAIAGRGWGDALYDRLQDFLDADSSLCACGDGFLGGDGQQVLELLFDGGKIGIRKIDLVDDGDDGQGLLVRQMDVGHCLGFDTLSGVDNQDRSFAGGQAPGDLVGKVDVTRGVHEIEGILLTILCPVLHGDGVGLDRDSALPLQIHRVEHLLLLVAVGDGVGNLQQAVRQGCLPMVDMGDDAEISDVRDGHGQSININEVVKRVNQDAWFVKKRPIKPLRKRQAGTIFM